LTLLGLAVVVAAVAAIWLVEDSLVTEVAATAIIVLVSVAAAMSLRSSHQVTTALWNDTMERRRELADVHRELGQLRSQQVELLLELRSLRTELAALSDETARSLQLASDHRDLMHEMLVPRQPVADPVYPSMHLPLVRAAFSTEMTPTSQPAQSETESRLTDSYPERDESSGSEPFPPRQLLDLTASEIARLRPAN
jgi:hypothetical protein